MKKIIMIIATLSIFYSFSYAEENISTTFKKIYSPDDGNHYGVWNYWLSNGYIEFPKTVQYYKKAKAKAIRGKEYYPYMGVFGATSKIPHTDEMMNYFISKIWGEKNFLNILKSEIWTLPKIKILWSDYKCSDYTTLYFRKINLPGLDTLYQPCMFEEKKEFFTNTENNESYTIYSEKNQNIKIKIFPVDQRKYIFDSYNEFEHGTWVPLFLVDPILHYYNMIISFRDSNRQWIGGFTKDKIKKKYQIVEYNRVWKYWDTFLTYWIFPYYELELELTTWLNSFQIEYLTYTPSSGYGYYISE